MVQLPGDGVLAAPVSFGGGSLNMTTRGARATFYMGHTQLGPMMLPAHKVCFKPSVNERFPFHSRDYLGW